jgi:uncharacterized protein
MIASLTTPHAKTRRIACYVSAAFIALSVIGAARTAAAQAAAPAAPTPQPSAAAVQLAKQILTLKHVQDIFQPMVRGVVIKTRDTFMQTNFMWGKDLNEVAANLQKQYAPRAGQLVDAAARIYASHFTEQELTEILAFDRSPLGQKLLTEEPKALDESMANADKWADNLSLEVIDSMRAEMKKRGHDI